MHSSYIVNVKNMEMLPKERAVLWVSVGGGRDFEGQRFADIASWAISNFQEVWVDLADTDKAINYEAFEEYPSQQAYQYAKTMGDLWLTQHSSVLERIPETHILRYDHWTSNKSYPALKKKIDCLFNTDSHFQEVVLQEAKLYASKKAQWIEQNHIDACKEYILREISSVCVRAKELEAVCLYPGQQKESFRLVREKLVKGAPVEMSLETYAGLTVRRRHKNKDLILQHSC